MPRHPIRSVLRGFSRHNHRVGTYSRDPNRLRHQDSELAGRGSGGQEFRIFLAGVATLAKAIFGLFWPASDYRKCLVF